MNRGTGEEAREGVDPLRMVEEEREKWKAEWESKSPEEREQSVRSTLDRHYRAMGWSDDEIEKLHEGAYAEARAKWEDEWREKQAREAAGRTDEG